MKGEAGQEEFEVVLEMTRNNEQSLAAEKPEGTREKEW